MAEPTTYIVLQEDHAAENVWQIEGRINASSSEGAIRLFCKAADKPAGTYVAVPQRSWKPVTVRAETSVTLKLEDAS